MKPKYGKESIAPQVLEVPKDMDSTCSSKAHPLFYPPGLSAVGQVRGQVSGLTGGWVGMSTSTGKAMDVVGRAILGFQCLALRDAKEKGECSFGVLTLLQTLC